MAISCNLPLAEAVLWLLNLAPTGIIEFVPKQDPMVTRMLAIREDIFSDYREDVFLNVIKSEHDIKDQHKFAANGRLLVSYRRR